MSYIESNLLSGENIVKRAKVHFFIYATSALLMAFSFFMVFSAIGTNNDILGTATFIFFLGLAFFADAFLKRLSTEFAVTNKRVIAKNGFISRKTIEINLNKVEGLNVDQGVFGRILNFGTVTVKGTGGASAPFKFIADPLSLRKALNEQLGTNAA